MFVTTDPFLQGGARARRPVPFCTSVPIPAIFSQIRRQGRAINISSMHEQNAPRVFSSLRTLFHAPRPEPPRIQSVTNPSLHIKSTTLAFPVTSELLARVSAPERKSTPLFSIACALFYKNTGGGVCTSLPGFNSFKMIFLRYPT